MEIKCSCCNQILHANDAVCDICGMSVILDTNEDKNFARDMTRNYIRSRLGELDIELLCYQYAYDKNKLSTPAKVYRRICSAGDYEVGKRVYFEEEFEETPSDISFSVEIRLRQGNRSLTKNFGIKPDKVISHRKLGVEFREKLRACIVIGEADNVVYSTEFALERLI